MRRVRVEWHLLHNCGQRLPANLHLELSAFFGLVQWQVGRPDRNAECWAHGSAAHLTARQSGATDGIAMPRKRTVSHREAYKLARNPRCLLLLKRRLADEVSLLELYQPTKSGFIRSGGVVNIVSVQRHTHFKAEGVSSPQACRHH